jgi:hypothetical protein
MLRLPHHRDEAFVMDLELPSAEVRSLFQERR